MTAIRKHLADRLHPPWMVQIRDIGDGVFARCGDACGSALGRDCIEARHEVTTHIERNNPLVTTDAHVILSAHVQCMLDVRDHVVRGRRPTRVEKGHQIDPNHTPTL